MTANHRPLEESDIELIDRVRATPCLYDTKDINFRFVYKKEQEWQSIAEGLDMTHWEARKRWTVLRDRYARELKQLILHPDSTEYGKNDFFRRMNFIRNFVKKREAKRKRSRNIHEEIEPKPIKLYRVKCEYSNFDSETSQTLQRKKSYIVEDSQDLSSSKFSYDEQMSQESLQQSNEHDDINDVEEIGGEQDYHEYVEDTSTNYDGGEEQEILDHQEDAENYMLTSSVSKSNIVIKPECSKLAKTFSMTAIQDDNEDEECTVSQKPILKNDVIEDVTSDLSLDVEETFSKTIAFYLRQLSPRYKIKAKVEMMQIIEKYIDLEESKS